MFKKLYTSLLISAIITGALGILFALGFFENWHDSLSNKLFTSRPINPDIVIIGIDNKSISSIGRFPWDRKTYIGLLDKISGHASSIGMDISFLETQDSESDSAFAQALKRAGNVTIAAEMDGNKIITPLPIFTNVAKVGVVDSKPSPDGYTRHMVINSQEAESPFKHFSVSITETYLFATNRNADILKNLPLEDGLLRINFAGPPGTIPEYSFVDVLNGTIPTDKFDGKIVLIGATANDLHDTQLVPTSNGIPMSGVEIHAHTIQTLLDQKYLMPETKTQTFINTAIIVFVSTIILTYIGAITGLIVIIILAISYIIFGVLSFDSGVIRNLVFPLLAILTSGVASIAYKYFSENRQKTFIRKAFGHYLSEEVLKEILENPKKLSLGGTRKEITVLFSDVAGFTGISEKLDPETLAGLLNEYLTEMTRIVFDHKGVLDKYIGDAIMAFWGAPLKDSEHALNACKTALLMQEKMIEIKKSWMQHNVHNFDIRIGINTGAMIVGNMGSHMRFDYTLLGDNVNLGSRLEGINKEYGTKIIISEQTHEEVKEKVIARKLDTVAVKGKKQGIVIYELRGIGTPSEGEKALLNSFEEARELYEKGQFKNGLTQFRKFKKTYTSDKPAEVYIERCQELIKNRPETWDGIFVATSK